jgi:hypothetical protein
LGCERGGREIESVDVHVFLVSIFYKKKELIIA